MWFSEIDKLIYEGNTRAFINLLESNQDIKICCSALVMAVSLGQTTIAEFIINHDQKIIQDIALMDFIKSRKSHDFLIRLGAKFNYSDQALLLKLLFHINEFLIYDVQTVYRFGEREVLYRAYSSETYDYLDLLKVFIDNGAKLYIQSENFLSSSLNEYSVMQSGDKKQIYNLLMQKTEIITQDLITIIYNIRLKRIVVDKFSSFIRILCKNWDPVKNLAISQAIERSQDKIIEIMESDTNFFDDWKDLPKKVNSQITTRFFTKIDPKKKIIIENEVKNIIFNYMYDLTTTN